MYLRRRGAEGEDRVREQVQREEGRNWADVKPCNRRDHTSEKVEVKVGDRKDGLQQRDTLRLREPGEKDAQCDQTTVESDKIQRAINEQRLCSGVARDHHHCERGHARRIAPGNEWKYRACMRRPSACQQHDPTWSNPHLAPELPERGKG
eukprot:CAMPEP_0119355688 /NCGR_PEP_ID=MMETSP1334-20130426/4488_1 /TAXON_ID=127549 /ORGANISM="Calcidiscus leptoporus, Strain RCC1130" /LENGTH=149 /DNA_ID=CAMNT_0007369579 /DNA_START=495 /DNA_END=941 /DNA_ORIENTATION=+